MTLPFPTSTILEANQLDSLDLPPGVELRGKTLRICFAFEGRRCREIVSRGNVDALSISLADRLRAYFGPP